MEKYGTQSDPAILRSVAGTETGLEESMWKLELSHDGDDDDQAYPERPDEADCIYYMRTGFCGYGPRCRYNHPHDRTAIVLRADQGDYPERTGQPPCQYYMRTGMCKFGASCKYHHPRNGGPGSNIPVNYLGYPLRPGEKECIYYVKTGHCKFGATCKFHHPQPDGMQVPTAPAPALYPPPMQSPSATSTQQYGVLSGNWPLASPPPLLQGSYIQGYGPMMLPPGMVSIAGWNPYAAPANTLASPGTQSTVGPGQYYGITQLSPSAPAYTGAYQLIPSSVAPSSSIPKEHAYPERHGLPECQFYMKTGECKFGSSCRYHHPRELISHQTSVVLSPMNLPLRSGTSSCSYYAQHGVCKFGPTCKFDHPMGRTLNYSPSASSLTDMPVAPYPVGSSSLGALVQNPDPSAANSGSQLQTST